MYPWVHNSPIHNNQDMDKHMYSMEHYSAMKKDEMLFGATWVDLDIIILSKVS